MKKALTLLIAIILALPVAAQQRKGTAKRPAVRKTTVKAPQKMMNAEELDEFLEKNLGESFSEYNLFENYTIKTRLIKMFGQKDYQKIVNHYNTELQELIYVDGIYCAYGGTAHNVSWGTAWGYDPQTDRFMVCSNVFDENSPSDYFLERDEEGTIPQAFMKFADQYLF